jgi:hypothetical protein
LDRDDRRITVSLHRDNPAHTRRIGGTHRRELPGGIRIAWLDCDDGGWRGQQNAVAIRGKL